MYRDTKKAERSEGQSAKVYAVPAAILAAWLMMFGGVIASVSGRPALHSSIQTVLGTPSSSPVTFAQR